MTGGQLPELAWEDLGQGAQVLRLWASRTGPEQPHIIVLRLTGEAYAEYDKNPAAYFARHRIFPAPVRSVTRSPLWRPDNPADRLDEYSVLGEHMQPSDSFTLEAQSVKIPG